MNKLREQPTAASVIRRSRRKEALIEATEWRQKVAHSVSRGIDATEPDEPLRGDSGLASLVQSFSVLSPLRGLTCNSTPDPRLTPWATLCRAYGAGEYSTFLAAA